MMVFFKLATRLTLTAFSLMCLFGSQLAFGTLVSTTGSVSVIPAPASVVPGALESDTVINVFLEKPDYKLTSDIDVQMTAPGTEFGDSPTLSSAGIVPAGTRVNSYLVHMDLASVISQSGSGIGLLGTLDFSNKILGVIFSSSDLDASDGELGAAGTTYPASGSEIFRGALIGETSDSVTLVDPAFTPGSNIFAIATLLVVGSVDQVRILTAIPEPSSFLFGSLFAVVGGCGLLGKKWRK